MHSRRFAPRPTRRNVLAGALVAGTGLVVPRSVFAQDATPAAVTEPIRTLTREEFVAQLEEELGYTEAATPGGTFIDSNVNDIQTIHPLLADDGPSLSVVGLLYDALIGGDVRTGQPAPTAWPTIGRLPPTVAPTRSTSTRTRSGTTARTLPPTTCSSPSMPWPTRRSAPPTPRAFSMRRNRGG